MSLDDNEHQRDLAPSQPEVADPEPRSLAAESGSVFLRVVKNPELLSFVGIAVVPVIAFLVYPIPPTYQSPGLLDPFYYTAYMQNFDEMVARFRLPYYPVRFGLIFPGLVLSRLFGAVAGFYTLRYLLTVGALLAFFRCTRRNLGVSYAVAGIVLLLATPEWYRILLWDHPDAVAVPYLLAAVSLLFTEQTKWIRLRAATVGVLFALAIHSNLFTITIIGFASVAALVYHKDRWKKLLLVEAPFVLAGAALVHLIGVGIFYYKFDFWQIHEPSMRASKMLATGGAMTWVPKDFTWMKTFLDIYLVPFLLISLCVTGTRALGCRLTRATTVFGLLSGSFFYYWQFLYPPGGYILSFQFYSSYLLPCWALLFPCVLKQLVADMSPNYRRVTLALLVSVILVLPFVGYLVVHIRGLEWVTVAWSALLTIVGLFLLRRVNLAKIFLVPVWGLLMIVQLYRPPYNGWAHPQMEGNLDFYRLAVEFVHIAPPHQVGGEVRFWYSNKHRVINSLQATHLWGNTRLQGMGAEDEGMPVVGETMRERLQDPKLRYLILIGLDGDEIEAGLKAFGEEIPDFDLVERKTYESGPYSVETALLKLPLLAEQK